MPPQTQAWNKNGSRSYSMDISTLRLEKYWQVSTGVFLFWTHFFQEMRVGKAPVMTEIEWSGNQVYDGWEPD